jgi:hypothetical protein
MVAVEVFAFALAFAFGATAFAFAFAFAFGATAFIAFITFGAIARLDHTSMGLKQNAIYLIIDRHQSSSINHQSSLIIHKSLKHKQTMCMSNQVVVVQLVRTLILTLGQPIKAEKIA